MNKHWEALDALHGNEPAEPIDWAARFRMAADVAEGARCYAHADRLLRLSLDVERGRVPHDVIEAIGRALLGEKS